MALRRKQYLLTGVLVVGLFLLIFVQPGWLKIVGFIMALTAIVLHWKTCRCPNCGALIRQRNAEYCSACGEKIDWDG